VILNIPGTCVWFRFQTAYNHVIDHACILTAFRKGNCNVKRVVTLPLFSEHYRKLSCETGQRVNLKIP